MHGQFGLVAGTGDDIGGGESGTGEEWEHGGGSGQFLVFGFVSRGRQSVGVGAGELRWSCRLLPYRG